MKNATCEPFNLTETQSRVTEQVHHWGGKCFRPHNATVPPYGDDYAELEQYLLGLGLLAADDLAANEPGLERVDRLPFIDRETSEVLQLRKVCVRCCRRTETRRRHGTLARDSRLTILLTVSGVAWYSRASACGFSPAAARLLIARTSSSSSLTCFFRGRRDADRGSGQSGS